MKINLPGNLSSEDYYLFPDLSYEETIPKVIYAKDVYITKSGIVFKHFRILKESIHRHKYLYFTFFKIVVANFLFKKKKALPDNSKYIIIHNLWCRGYYHWICEALPRLWAVKEELSEYVLLLPKNYTGFQAETLNTFSFKDILLYQDNIIFKARDLLVPENPAKLYEPDPHICSAIRKYYQGLVGNDLLEKFFVGERIYITRKNAANRKVANEDVIEKVLNKYNFKIVAFEKCSFIEQLAVMYKVKYLISIHGAGLTNMHFMKEGGSVLELYKKRVPKVDWGRGRRNDLPNPCYMRLSTALQHNYYIQFCEAIDPKVPAGSADIVVNIEEFENNICHMIKVKETMV